MIGILTDITKCVGCRKCVKACQSMNMLTPETPLNKAKPEELFDTRCTTIIQKKGPGEEPRFVRKHCRHCKKPSCVAVCPVGALKETKKGYVWYDKSICLGCRYCILACPYGIPRYEWHSRVPAVIKCTFCFERLNKGEEPACTEICPEKATIFGEREALLKEAKIRLADSSVGYVQKVYGEHEIGGTSVLYVSDIPLDFLGLRKDFNNEPLPELTWDILKQTPAITGVMGVSLTGIYWLTKRKNDVKKAGKKKTDTP
jgi:formate dehydrogenase iron-sulfur subunit